MTTDMKWTKRYHRKARNVEGRLYGVTVYQIAPGGPWYYCAGNYTVEGPFGDAPTAMMECEMDLSKRGWQL